MLFLEYRIPTFQIGIFGIDLSPFCVNKLLNVFIFSFTNHFKKLYVVIFCLSFLHYAKYLE